MKEAKKALKRAIKKARRGCWEDFVNRAEGDDIWAVTRYTKPQRSTVVPTISHRVVTADSHAEKAAMLMEISFPPPTPYDGGAGAERPLAIDE